MDVNNYIPFSIISFPIAWRNVIVVFQALGK